VVCTRTDSPTTDLRGVFGSFLTARMGVSVGRLPQEVLLKNSIGVSVPRPCGSDVYVCSESCRLCLTVVY
jgi:hypothetical protein